MAKGKKLTYVCYISIDGADPVPLESLTEEQRQRWQDGMRERLQRTFNEYYAQHPEEYAALPDAPPQKRGEKNEHKNAAIHP